MGLSILRQLLPTEDANDLEASVFLIPDDELHLVWIGPRGSSQVPDETLNVEMIERANGEGALEPLLSIPLRGKSRIIHEHQTRAGSVKRFEVLVTHPQSNPPHGLRHNQGSR